MQTTYQPSLIPIKTASFINSNDANQDNTAVAPRVGNPTTNLFLVLDQSESIMMSKH